MNIAIVLAGGTGTRMNLDIPKQYVKIDNRMIIEYCLETIFTEEILEGVLIVTENEWRTPVENIIHSSIWGKDNIEKFLGFAMPGENRQLSIYNGLMEIKLHRNQWDESKLDEIKQDIIFVHDAARPMLTHTLIKECIKPFEDKSVEGVLPVLPMKDTIYLSEDGEHVSGLLDRSQLFAGQAPEAFLFDKYLEANEKLLPDRIKTVNGSTEPAILAGMKINTIKGDENNFKITTQADLVRFKKMMICIVH